MHFLLALSGCHNLCRKKRVGFMPESEKYLYSIEELALLN